MESFKRDFAAGVQWFKQASDLDDAMVMAKIIRMAESGCPVCRTVAKLANLGHTLIWAEATGAGRAQP